MFLNIDIGCYNREIAKNNKIVKFMNRIAIIVICLIVFSNICLYSQLKPEYIDKKGKVQIYLANAVIGKGVDTTILEAGKIKPALYYITQLNDKYELVSDSAVNEAINRLNKPSAFEIAHEIFADRIFIIKIEQLVNVIRCEIISASIEEPNIARTSEGIAVLHLFKKSNQMPYFDPTILTAMQRAFAAVENDSLMFINLAEPYNVKPAPSIVIAGIEFIDDDNYVNWEIFNNPLMNSFEYTDLIYKSIYKSLDWVVFDIDSRDAIYGLYNLFLIENHIAPSYNELSALQRFNIEHYITGTIKRNVNGINITLQIRENKDNSNKIIKEVSKNIYNNNINEIRDAIKDLAIELVFN
jgi:hypothetical protein